MWPFIKKTPNSIKPPSRHGQNTSKSSQKQEEVDQITKQRKKKQSQHLKKQMSNSYNENTKINNANILRGVPNQLLFTRTTNYQSNASKQQTNRTMTKKKKNATKQYRGHTKNQLKTPKTMTPMFHILKNQ